ncbi:MAG: hypothetical protein HOM37_05920 [Acidimicrobiaceae bacterium]|nr:hypothetical protein [Acidimicrobiaceae bacterium]
MDGGATSAASVSGGTNNSYGVYNSGSSSAQVADPMLDGAVSGAGFTCLNTYTEAFVALDEVCAVIP